MRKVKVSTFEELKNARKNKIEEIMVAGDLINKVKRATLYKKICYWAIVIFLLLGFNFLISSRVIDFYAVFHLDAIGIKRSLSAVIILVLVMVFFIFGLISSSVSNYKLSYIDKFFKSGDTVSLYKVWYF